MSDLVKRTLFCDEDLSVSTSVQQRVEACNPNLYNVLLSNLRLGPFVFSLSKDYYGNPLDVIKSGMQKSIRRGKFHEAWWCALSISMYAVLMFENKKDNQPENNNYKGVKRDAQRIISNLWNRLLIIVSEDISLAAPYLPATAYALYEKGLSNPLNRSYLYQMVKILCSVPKTRVLSHLGAMYWRPTGFAWSSKQPEYACHYHYLRNDNLCNWIKKKAENNEGFRVTFGAWLSKLNNDYSGLSKERRLAACKFFTLLVMRSDLAYYIASVHFVQNAKLLKTAIKRHKKPIFLGWDIIENFCKSVMDGKFLEQILALKKMYVSRQSNNESPLFFYHAIGYIVCRRFIIKQESPCFKVIDAKEISQISLLKEYFTNGTIHIDESWIDKHTRLGRHKTSLQFAIEGAKLNNEDTRFRHQNYVESYLKQKEIESNGLMSTKKRKKEEDDIFSLPTTIVQAKKQKVVVDSDDPKLFLAKMPVLLDVPYGTKESDFFVSIQRARVMTSKHRPGTFYNLIGEKWLNSNIGSKVPYPVFCKGPFMNMLSLQPQLDILELKKNYDGISTISYQVVHLVPIPASEMGNPPKFGTRTKVVPGKAYPFLIMEDLCKRSVPAPQFHKPYPVKEYGRESGCWPAKTLLADTGARPGKIENMIDNTWLLYEFVLESLFRFVWGITDTCSNNFLLTDNGVWGIDEENYGFERETIFKKPLKDGSVAKLAYMSALDNDWEAINRTLKKWVRVRKQPIWVRKNIYRMINRKHFIISRLSEGQPFLY